MKKKKTVGILNEGQDISIINNEFHNLDIGIHDKGKRTFTSGNKFFRTIKNKKFWKQFWIYIVIGGLFVTIVGGTIVHLLTKKIG